MEETHIDSGLNAIAPLHYKPLRDPKKNIRLLQILPESTSPNFSCTLTEGTLDASYVCLSYQWGTDIASHPILIDNELHYVRDNLWAFLQQAREGWPKCCPDERAKPCKACTNRPKRPPKMYWIDAICINQENIIERNAQVQSIGLIYKSADHVISWLGTGDADIQAAFDFIHANETLQTAYLSLDQKDPKSQLPPKADRIKALNDPTNPNEYVKAFARILMVTYWTRLWTVQELILGKELWFVYGSVGITYVSLIELSGRATHMSSMFYDPRMQSHGLRTLNMHTFARDGELDAQFLYIVGMCLDYGCHDPLDRIFALRSLVSDSDNIPVDYQADAAALMMQLFASHSSMTPFFDGNRLMNALNISEDEILQQTDIDCSIQAKQSVEWIGIIGSDHSGHSDTRQRSYKVFFDPESDAKHVLDELVVDGLGSVGLKAGDIFVKVRMANVILIFEDLTGDASSATHSTSASVNINFNTCKCTHMLHIKQAVVIDKSAQKFEGNIQWLTEAVPFNPQTASRIRLEDESAAKNICVDWEALTHIWLLMNANKTLFFRNHTDVLHPPLKRRYEDR